MIHRRNFLVGLVSALAAPAIVRAENIMPVRALIIPPHDPLVKGIRWQTWPFGALQPECFATGSINVEIGDDRLRPLSHYVKSVERHRVIYEELHWMPVYPPHASGSDQ